MEWGDSVRGHRNDVLGLVEVGEIIFWWCCCTSVHVIEMYGLYYNTIRIENAGGGVYNACGTLNHGDCANIDQELLIS